MLTVRVYKLQVLAQAKASGITDDKCNQIRAMQLHTVLVIFISYETIFKYDIIETTHTVPKMLSLCNNRSKTSAALQRPL